MWSALSHPRRLLILLGSLLALAALLLPGAQSGFVRVGACGPVEPDWSALVVPALASSASGPGLEVVTYNLHSGLGAGVLPLAPRAQVEANLRTIARHIADAAAAPADIVALNEVDFGSRRSGWLDQAAFLAAELTRLTGVAYEVIRGETWRREIPGLEVRFGNALLSRHPVLDSRSCLLGGGCDAPAERWFGPEPRGVLQATLAVHGRALGVLVTHLEAFAPGVRERQAAELAMRLSSREGPTLLLGDMNALAASAPRRRWLVDDDRSHDILTAGRLQDARVVLAARAGLTGFSPWATYPASAPVHALDGAFATPELLPDLAAVVGDAESSDHRGLRVRYRWVPPRLSVRQARWHQGLQRRQRARLQDCYRPRARAAPALQAIWGARG